MALLTLAAGCGASAAPPAAPPSAEAVRSTFATGLEGVIGTLDSLAAILADGSPDTATGERARRTFERARDAYKRIEYLVEYYAPTAAEQINGPALPHVEEDDANRFEHPPEGFQVVEEHLYPEVRWAERDALVNDVAILRGNLHRVAQLTAASTFADAHVWEAARLEVVRVATLGLAGFDAPVSLRSIPEAAAALQGAAAGLAPYAPRLEAAAPAALRTLDASFDSAVAFLREGASFEDFDRLAFMRVHVPALLGAIGGGRSALGLSLPPEPRALRPEATNLFAAAAFDPHFFAPPGDERPTPARVEMGHRLFFDPVLSGDSTRSCATCHMPERAFTDGRARSLPLPGANARVLRNAPTLINSGLQAATFYDNRTRYLEDQVTDVVRSRDEMHGDLAAAAARIVASPAYAGLSRRAFPGADAIGAEEVRRAVAAYVRSLIALDSRFDRYMRGEDAALSAGERRGFNLFMGKAACGACHFAPLFNGTVPPTFLEAEVEVLGTPAASDGTRVDTDPGRLAVYGIEIHRHAFKTPTVRNAQLTAPYMHNGVYATLEEVIDFYDAGGGAGLGLDVPNQTLPADSLRLTAREKADLVAFLLALTDTTRLTARPRSAEGRVATARP